MQMRNKETQTHRNNETQKQRNKVRKKERNNGTPNQRNIATQKHRERTKKEATQQRSTHTHTHDGIHRHANGRRGGTGGDRQTHRQISCSTKKQQAGTDLGAGGRSGMATRCSIEQQYQVSRNDEKGGVVQVTLIRGNHILF